jgi:transposase-like protein
MNSSTHFVVLGNGKKVSWSEFTSWDGIKQKNSLNPPSLGKFWDEGMRAALSKKLKEKYLNERSSIGQNKKNGRSKQVMTPNGMFPTIKNCADFFNVKTHTMVSWINDEKKPDFYFPNHISKIKSGARAVSTPAGTFNTLTAAAKHYKVDQNTIKKWIDGKGKLAGQLKFILSKPKDSTIITPFGKFSTLTDAALASSVSAQTISVWIKNGKEGYSRLEPSMNLISCANLAQES